MAERTLFEKIMAGEIPADVLYEDDQCIAFADINPQAPVHFLVVPRKPIPSLNELDDSDAPLVGHLYLVAKKLMEEKGEPSFRTVFNCGEQAGQTVWHLHLHVLAGRPLAWPPG